jgi:heterodisulfide reductase subunit A
MNQDKPRVGVYICHCGTNIAGTVDVAAVAETVGGLPGVAVARHYPYMCSEPGQEIIKKDIQELGLERVVVAACSPRMHEPTFQRVLAEAGLNSYYLQIANVREQCSWITDDCPTATTKASRLIRAAVSRVGYQERLEPRYAPVTPAALVVGGGIAGIQAALSIAGAGYKVYLVEKNPSIGGRMAQLDKTFPTLDCSACILTPKMVNVARHPNVELLTYSEVEAVSGYVGNFNVTVTRKPRYVDVKACTGCGECVAVCPVKVPDEFDMKLRQRTAIYREFAQAVPSAYVIDKQPSPCRSACPAHIPVQGYIALIAQGLFKEAVELLRQYIPFPAVCGRVCPAPCETACKRANLDEALAIRGLKRFVADYVAEEYGRPRGEPVVRRYDETVAIVGAGPSGLAAAYDLVRVGYGVTVFEAAPVAGGMLALGIPAYRLPRKVLSEEIDYIRQMGVDIRLNTAVGTDLTLEALTRQYHAVFLAVGASRSARLGIPGENLTGVMQGLDFLRDVNLGRQVTIGQRVAVIGGGNTAVDAARTALRLGAQSVTIIYRRSRAEMPAIASEVAAAEQEDVHLRLLAAPVEVLGHQSKVVGLRCIRMELGEPDASGRRRPVPVPGSEFDLDVDTVIAAIGQSVDLAMWGQSVPINRWGTIEVDPETMATSIPGIFAGGDAATGPATVIEAIATGKRAAESIHRYLRGQDMLAGRRLESEWPRPETIEVTIPKTSTPKPRAIMPELLANTRARSFKEVELGFTADVAVTEAARCLNCAICSECQRCVTVCGRNAINHDMREEKVELNVGTIILATGHDFFDASRLPQYNYGRFPNVLESMEFERMCSAGGPTGGKVLTTERVVPRRVAVIHCVGSRDINAQPYCSRLCCMHAMKQAHLVRERTGADVYEFYIDIRAAGKGYEEFYERVQREGVIFVRGRGAEVMQRGGQLVVKAEETGLGRPLILPVDMVILSTGMSPRSDAGRVARTFHVTRDKDGFFLESHPKLHPFNTNTDGIFLAGTCQAPRDIPDTVAHANAAAAEALAVLGKGQVVIEPITSWIDAGQCSGCRVCVDLCPYLAISVVALDGRQVAVINEALCKGCGTCVAACPAGAITARHFTDQQIFAEIEGLLL